MLVYSKLLVVLFVITTIPANTGIKKRTETANDKVLIVNRFSVLRLVRKPRELIVGHGCSKGSIWYYGRCKSLKKLQNSDYDDITSIDKRNKITPKTIVQKEKPVETDFYLSILPLSTAVAGSKITKEPKAPVFKPNYMSNNNLVEVIPTKMQIDLSVTKPIRTVTQQKYLIADEVTKVDSTPTVDEVTSVLSHTATTTVSIPVLEEITPAITDMATASGSAFAVDEKTSIMTDAVIQTDPSITKPLPTVTQDKFSLNVRRFDAQPAKTDRQQLTTTDLSPDVMGITPELTNAYNVNDLTPAVEEINTAMTYKDATTEPTFFKVEMGSKATKINRFATLNTFESEISSIVVKTTQDTRATQTESSTTYMDSESTLDTLVRDDHMSYVLSKVQSCMYTVMVVVGCFIIINWICELLNGMFRRREGYENRDSHLKLLSKQQESIV